MGMQARRVLVASVLAVAAAGLAPTTTAEAFTVPTRYASTNPVTWVDDQGRQYLVTEVLHDDNATLQLVVARATAVGDPDPAWGSYLKPGSSTPLVGVRALDLAAPAEGYVREPVIAADDDGVLTTSWRAGLCTPNSTDCDRWWARFTAEGDPVGAPVHLGVSDRPDQALPDGSMATYGNDGILGWRGPDGTERGAPALLSGEVSDVAVDASGRLLVATKDLTVRRWPVGGPVDLALPVPSCGDSPFLFLAPSVADDGFATLCSRTEAEPLAVERRTSDGTLSWRTSAPAFQADGRMGNASAAVIDGNDRVWIGSAGPLAWMPTGSRAVFVQSFTEDGPEAMAWWRPSDAFGSYEYGPFQVAELRPLPDGRVAVADDERCCTGNGFTVAEGSAHAEVVAPLPMQPPTCTVEALEVTAADEGSISIAFDRCDPRELPHDRQPTGYRVDVASPGAATRTEEVSVAPSQVRASLTVPATGGHLATVTVTVVNQAGDGPAATAVAVAPFTSLDAFARWHQVHVMGNVDPWDHWIADDVERLATEELTPPELVAEELDGGLARGSVEPVARLYRTYFLRDADPDGLRFWIARYGSWGRLIHISEHFSRSSEFVRTYGHLSNRAFVTLLYRNAFDRDPDPGGLEFWTRRLDSGRNGRGEVMLQFSESSEGKRLAAPRVEPLSAAWLLVGRLPTAAEWATWSTAADHHLAAATDLLATEEFADRIG